MSLSMENLQVKSLMFGSGVAVHSNVKIATITSGTLATDFENGDSVDGVVLSTGDRILIKNQSTGSENGLYTVEATGAPVRASDLETGSSANSIIVWVSEGIVNANTGWICTNSVGSDVVGTDSLVFAQFDVASTLSVPRGGTGAASLTSGNVLVGAGVNTVSTTKAAPTGAFVGTNDTQTLTNKTLTSPRIGTAILDTNGNELLNLTATGSAVNEFTLANAATGNSPVLSATGNDADISISLQAKGTGVFNLLSTTSAPAELRLFEDVDDGVNYVGLRAGTIGSNISFTLPITDGSSGDILQTNGAGVLSFATPSSGSITEQATDVILIGSVAQGATVSGDRNLLCLNAPSALASNGNILLGANSGEAMTSSPDNIIVGHNSATAITTAAAGSIVIGNGSHLCDLNNIVIGNASLNNAGTVVSGNIAIGDGIAQAITSGSNNILIGDDCAPALTTANGNTIIGRTTCTTLTEGSSNVVIGSSSATSLTTGQNNVVIGQGSHGGSIGNANTIIGQNAATGMTVGEGNVVIGRSAGNSLTGTDDNTLIGRNTDCGGFDGSIALGAGATVTQSNDFVVANNVVQIVMNGLTTHSASDTITWNSSNGRIRVLSSAAKYKSNIRDIEQLVDTTQVYNLRPRAFTFNPPGGDPEQNRIGLVADEAEPYLPQLVSYMNGEIESFSYLMLPVVMLVEMKKIKLFVDFHQQTIDDNRRMVDENRRIIEKQQQQIAKLNALISSSRVV